MKLSKGLGTAIFASLVLGLLCALGSGLFEQVAMSHPEGTYVRWCGGVAARLFTLAAFFLLLCGMQWQRSKLLNRLQKLDEELAALKGRL